MMKVLWLSRHTLAEDQLADLRRIYGEIEVNQHSDTVTDIESIRDLVEEAEVAAIVAPLELQVAIKAIADRAGTEVIIPKNGRRFVNGEKVTFTHEGWYRLERLEYEIEKL